MSTTERIPTFCVNEKQTIDLSTIDSDRLIQLVQQERVNVYVDADGQISDKDRIALLNSISDTALKLKRIDADKEIANNQVTAKDLLQVISQIGNPFFHPDSNTPIPSSPDLPIFEAVPGELDTQQHDIQLEELS